VTVLAPVFSRAHKLARPLSGIVIGLGLSAVGLEVAARVTKPGGAIATTAERVNYASHEHDAAGFHDREHSLRKPPGVHRLIVLGDSFTMGEWVPLDELFVTRLERSLNARPGGGSVELVNLALGGMDTTQEVALLRRTGLAYEPVAIFPLLLELTDDHPLRDVHGEIAEACGRLGIPSVDLFEVLRGQQARRLWVAPHDSHPNAIANELVVPALEEFVVKAGLVPATR